MVGDHHVHTTFSVDGRHSIAEQVRGAHAGGADWVVITDHGSSEHVARGEAVQAEIAEARLAFPDMLILPGLEWNVPGAAHGTVFTAVDPGSSDAAREFAVVREFEAKFDGDVRGARTGSADDDALAVEALEWLADRVRDGSVDDAVFLVNHPASDGYNHPRRLRRWRDVAGGVAIGFEGAPGHQGAALCPDEHRVRGFYSYGPRPNSEPRLPEAAYRTWGGFDWMTATVGGMWDALLAEGSRWWITASSDSHLNHDETARDPAACDFWPGSYSRTHVAVDRLTPVGLARGLRRGQVWVDHGHLLGGIDVRLQAADDRRGAGMGETLRPPRGADLELVVTVTAQHRPNAAGFVPRLNRLDIVVGAVTGPSGDGDGFAAPDARVVAQIDTSGRSGTYTLRHRLGPAETAMYVRLRGTDARRGEPGLLGVGIDPCGPARDHRGVNPWHDLWFYTNPVHVEPVGDRGR